MPSASRGISTTHPSSRSPAAFIPWKCATARSAAIPRTRRATRKRRRLPTRWTSSAARDRATSSCSCPAAARQRAGRGGRVAHGVCIRLYPEEDFAKRPAFTEPELLRSSLASVILRAKSLGLGEVADFPFLDPPAPRAIADGYALLTELGAVDEQNELTAVGNELARLPLDPRVGRMLIAAREERCVVQARIIAAALSVQDPRERPLDKAQAADERHAR